MSWKIGVQPAIANWELWSVARMLIATKGDLAEAHARSRLADAPSVSDEGAEIVWLGVVNHILSMKAKR